MIARIDRVAVRQRYKRLGSESWQWVVGPAILAATIAYDFKRTASRPPTAQNDIVLEYVLAELPKQGWWDGPRWAQVEVFNPSTAAWAFRQKDYVKPGEEFRDLGSVLYKQSRMDGFSDIHGEVNPHETEDAYRSFDAAFVRDPTPNDVVYVLGQQLPKTGFHTLRYVGAGKTFRFQGRVFKTEVGSREDTVYVVDTGERLAKPGGDPNPKPLFYAQTEYTEKFFPDPKLPQQPSTEHDPL